jgi:hypothetical protein
MAKRKSENPYIQASKRLHHAFGEASYLLRSTDRAASKAIARCTGKPHSYLAQFLKDAPAARAELLECVRLIADAEHRIRAGQCKDAPAAANVVPFRKAS